MRKFFDFFVILIICLLNTKVYALTDVWNNLNYDATNDSATDKDKCPVSVTVQDNLDDGSMDFSLLNCMLYKMDYNGNYLKDENGNLIPRTAEEQIDFSCVQDFLDEYTNEEFKSAANGNKDSGFTQSNYCPIYCVESNEFVFPGYSPVANSGGHFTWTIGKINENNISNGLTVRLHGIKACRTQVDLDKWMDDYERIMKDIEKLITTRNSYASGDCTTTPDANSESKPENTFCAYDEIISTTYHKIQTEDWDVFRDFKELSSLVENGQYSQVLKGLKIPLANNNYLTNNAHIGSNRFYITSSITHAEDRHLDGIINIVERSNANRVTITPVGVAQNATSHYFDLQDRVRYTPGEVGPNGEFIPIGPPQPFPSSVITIRVNTHERHCCTWIPTGEYIIRLTNFNVGTTAYIIDPQTSRPIDSETFGYEEVATKLGCPSENNDDIKDPVIVKRGSQNLECCSSNTKCVRSETVSDGYCLGYPNITDEAACKYGAGGSWVSSGGTVCKEYACVDKPIDLIKLREYVAVCGAGDTGADINVVATGPTVVKDCSSVIRSCPDLSSQGWGVGTPGANGLCYYSKNEEIEKKLNELIGLVKELKNCYTKLEDFDYYLDTEMEVDYNETSSFNGETYKPSENNTSSKLVKIEDNTNNDGDENKLGKYNSEMIKPSNPSNKEFVVNFFGKNYKFNKDAIYFPYCTLSGLTKTCIAGIDNSLVDYWYDWYGKTYIALYEYKLVDNFYKWIKLPEGVSTSQEPTGDYKKYNRFIDVGHANYPVHFSTPQGSYEGLNIKINNIGYKNYLYNNYGNQIANYNKTLTDEKFKSSYSEEKNVLLHDCYYEVKEGEPFCPTGGCDNGGGSGDGSDDGLGGIRIIYRPISLENPFPSIDADGRVTGNNWCHLNNSDEALNCSNLNENVDRYILNNRNISGSSVYNKEPMYEINLTPALIKQIREYNKTTNYDDFNLSCSGEEGKTGRECRSNFVVNVSDIDLPSLRDYITGCGVGEWNDCDKLDGYDREHERFYSLTGYTVSNE